MPCKCGQKVDRIGAKIQCVGCNEYYHLQCVNLHQSDSVYMQKNSIPFRCPSCVQDRRKSLRSPPPYLQKEKQVHEESQVPVDDVQLPSSNNLSPQSANVNICDPPIITLEVLYNEITSLKVMTANAFSEIRQLQVENKALHSKVNNLQNSLNFYQQKALQKCVDVIGVPNVDNTNALDSAVKLMSEGLGESINPHDIKSCYVKTITTKSNSASTSAESLRVLRIKFSSLDLKQKILNKKKKTKLTTGLFGQQHATKQIFINESLTNYNRAVYNRAKKIKIEKQFSYLWISKGVILMKKKEGDKTLKICSFVDLENLS